MSPLIGVFTQMRLTPRLTQFSNQISCRLDDKFVDGRILKLPERLQFRYVFGEKFPREEVFSI